jgi:hypothetical protein
MSNSRHHRRYARTSFAAGGLTDPYAVSSRKRMYPRSGTGRKGGRRYQSVGVVRAHIRSAVDHSVGCATTTAIAVANERIQLRRRANRDDVADV